MYLRSIRKVGIDRIMHANSPGLRLVQKRTSLDAGRSAHADAALVIEMMGPRAAGMVPTATIQHIGEWLGWPDWLRKGSSLAGMQGPLPSMISRADDAIMMANIVESADVFGLVEMMLTRPRPALSLTGGLAVLHGPNLGESLMIVVRGFAARNIWVRFSVTRHGEDVLISLRPVWPMGELFDAFALCALTLLQRAVVAYCGNEVEGMKVATRFCGLPQAAAALAAFGCTVERARDAEALRFPLAWLDLPNPHYDPLVWDVVKAKIASQEHDADSIDPLDPLRDFIVDQLFGKHRVPRLKQAAVHLGISTRTIVRSLARQNTTYRKLVEEERKARALVLIADTSLSLAEVADTLGFSDMSSFGRSFRTWFGDTPGNLRRATSHQTAGTPLDFPARSIG